MSASNRKKIRKEQAMAYMSERQRKEAEEQKKMKRYTLTFWVVLALCVCIVLTTVVSVPVTSMLTRNTDAVTVGGYTLSAVELNYFYLDAINEWYNSYGSYATYFGLDSKKPLSSQVYDKTLGTTWADMFLNMALENIKSTYALYELAVKDNFKLSEDEQKSLDSMVDDLEATIKSYKELYQNLGYTYSYKNATDYIQGMYGKAATLKSYKAYYEVCTIAKAYYAAHSDSLEYDDAALRAFENGKFEQYSSYTYAYYYFNATNFREGGTKSEDGKTTTYTEAEKQAAIETAKRLAEEIAAGTYEDLDAFDKAINTLLTNHFNKNTSSDKNTKTSDTSDKTEGSDKTEDTDKKEEEKLKYTSTKMEDVLYSSVNSLFVDWIIGKVTSDKKDEDKKDEEVTLIPRKEGDLTVIVSESGSGDTKTVNGYYVVRFGSTNDNTFALKNVRHILVQFEGGQYNSTTGTTTYTQAEKDKAKADANALLIEFRAGTMTEDAFAALAKEKSDDTGSKENGGLYENVYPGQMVEPFEDWCYDENRKAGDVDLVETSYGWHIMYYVGDSETNYRDYMLENALRSEEMTEWHDGLVKAIAFKVLTSKYVNKDLILG